MSFNIKFIKKWPQCSLYVLLRVPTWAGKPRKERKNRKVVAEELGRDPLA